MSDAVCTGNIPITRNIDGFEFVLRSVHIQSIKELEARNKLLEELVSDGFKHLDAIYENEGVNRECADWILKAKKLLGKGVSYGRCRL